MTLIPTTGYIIRRLDFRIYFTLTTGEGSNKREILRRVFCRICLLFQYYCRVYGINYMKCWVAHDGHFSWQLSFHATCRKKKKRKVITWQTTCQRELRSLLRRFGGVIQLFCCGGSGHSETSAFWMLAWLPPSLISVSLSGRRLQRTISRIFWQK